MGTRTYFDEGTWFRFVPDARSAAAIGLLACGLSMAAENWRPPAAPEPAREIRYTSGLRANSSNAERYVVKGVCEREGLREVASILERTDFEEMWAFLPRAREGGDCQWHEIGREEKSRPGRATLRVDMVYLTALMADHTEIHLVHFHPLKYFECAASTDCPRQTGGGDAAGDKRWISDLVFSMPSPSDVHFMMNVTSRFLRRRQGHGRITHSVVTPYGVVDYRLTEQGLAKYDAERNERSEGLYIAWVAGVALDDERIERILKENPGSIEAAVPKLAQSLNTDFLRVVHTPNGAR